MVQDLTGKHAIVTGGGSGIGFDAARGLLRAGATVTICGRTASKLDDAVELLTPETSPTAAVTAVPCDITDESSVENLMAQAREVGPIDICVASAGGGMLGPLISMPADVWRNVVDQNLTGTFLTIKHVAREMLADGVSGSIVAISSLAGSTVHPYMSPYGAAKAGIDMLVAYAAEELGSNGIRVNALAPGFVQTELMEAVKANDRCRDSYIDNMPLGRLGEPSDVTSAVLWLAGSESSWVTGEVIRLDGGHHLRRGPDYSEFARMAFGDDEVDGNITREG